MAHTVFIDGEVGTTGLQIRDRLAGRSDISLISIDPDRRKDLDARLDCLARAEVGILCLPDAAASEVAGRVQSDAALSNTRLIDASTAHRVHDDWVYGFAELGTDRRAAIANAHFVSNPGCYSTGAIALLHPLVRAGAISPDMGLTINAVSGYSGGGRGMVEEFETGASDGFFVYGTGQAHKHIPEIIAYSGLSLRPAFVPSVGQFAQGMIVQIPLPTGTVATRSELEDILRAHYGDSRFVRIRTPEDYGPRIDPRAVNGTNALELSVHGADGGPLVLLALLDNLGKGASGAAVQNLNIMLGLDEAAGLTG